MKIRAGTSGWSYPEWKGHFYPAKIAAKDMLKFYAGHFGTVEVNNTFYRMPKPEALAAWAAEVPDEFQFVLKASKRITHDRRLGDVAESLDYMLRGAATLGPRLGPLLIQLPPNFRKDLARLRNFLAMLPAGTRAAFEFRNESWFDDEVYAAIRDAKQAWCVADTGEEGDPPFVATTDWGYLRLRKVAYTEDGLSSWAARMQEQRWSEAYVFFKHEDEGTGPKLARQFMEIVGAGSLPAAGDPQPLTD